MRREVRERLRRQKGIFAEAGVGKRLCVGALAGVFLFSVASLLPGSSAQVYAAEAELAEPAGTEIAEAETADVLDTGAVEDNVVDNAELFDVDEFAEINAGIILLEAESGWNIYAVTTLDAEGKPTADYADDFFDAHSPENENGVVLLIDMDNREITISTCGEARRYLSDERINVILDEAYTDIGNGYYGDCMMTMVEGVAQYYNAGIQGNQYNYDTQTGEISVYRSIEPFEALIAFAAALACGIIIYVSVVGKYRLHFETYHYEFRENSNVTLRVKEDRFVNQTLTHRRIPKQTTSSGGGGGSSSGRSSVHTSSSGRSHGGGSRKF